MNNDHVYQMCQREKDVQIHLLSASVNYKKAIIIQQETWLYDKF